MTFTNALSRTQSFVDTLCNNQLIDISTIHGAIDRHIYNTSCNWLLYRASMKDWACYDCKIWKFPNSGISRLRRSGIVRTITSDNLLNERALNTSGLCTGIFTWWNNQTMNQGRKLLDCVDFYTQGRIDSTEELYQERPSASLQSSPATGLWRSAMTRLSS